MKSKEHRQKHDFQNYSLRPMILSFLYLFWVLGFHSFLFTLFTYLQVQSGTLPKDIGETYQQYFFMFYTFSGVLFFFLYRASYPLTHFQSERFLTKKLMEKLVLPGTLSGIGFCLGITLSFTFSGHYQYFGFPQNLFETPYEVGVLLLKINFMLFYFYTEEYFLREKLFRSLQNKFSFALSMLLVTGFYLLLRNLQFSLGIMDQISLLILSVWLCLQSKKNRSFCYGAAWISTFLVMSSLLFSLPIFGVEFQGLLLFRYAPVDQTTFQWWSRFLTGGIGGPLSSFIFQLILAIQCIIIAIRKNDKLH